MAIETKEVRELLAQAGVIVPELDRFIHCEEREYCCWATHATPGYPALGLCEYHDGAETTCGADNWALALMALAKLIAQGENHA